jgi:hypothetical protein
MSDSSKKLTGKQLLFLMGVTGIKNPDGAIDMFLRIMIEEGIDPEKIDIYVEKMMKREKK